MGIILFRDRFIKPLLGIGENNLDKADNEFEYRRKLKTNYLNIYLMNIDAIILILMSL